MLGGDFTKDHDHTGLGGSLTSNLGERVLSQAGIEDGIGDLISDLVWVTLTDRLGLVKSVLNENGGGGSEQVNALEQWSLTVNRKVPCGAILEEGG